MLVWLWFTLTWTRGALCWTLIHGWGLTGLISTSPGTLSSTTIWPWYTCGPTRFGNQTFICKLQAHGDALIKLYRSFFPRYNNADGSNMNHFGDVYLLVYSTGNVLWVPPAQLQAFCKVDLRLWPHESPSCKVGKRNIKSWIIHNTLFLAKVW